MCLTLHALIFEQHALLQPKTLHRLLTCEIDLTRNSSTLQNLLWYASCTHLASTAYSNIHSNESCVQHISRAPSDMSTRCFTTHCLVPYTFSVMVQCTRSISRCSFLPSWVLLGTDLHSEEANPSLDTAPQ